MAIKINILADRMTGSFKLIRISDGDSGDLLLFGIYCGGYEGQLTVPPQSPLTKEIISDIRNQLIEKYPGSIWKLNFSKTPRKISELREQFEVEGIHVEIPEED